MVVDVCFRKECRKSEYMLIVARTDTRRNSHISQAQVAKKPPPHYKNILLMTRHLIFANLNEYNDMNYLTKSEEFIS